MEVIIHNAKMLLISADVSTQKRYSYKRVHTHNCVFLVVNTK